MYLYSPTLILTSYNESNNLTLLENVQEMIFIDYFEDDGQRDTFIDLLL